MIKKDPIIYPEEATTNQGILKNSQNQSLHVLRRANLVDFLIAPKGAVLNSQGCKSRYVGRR